jgi:hypothetical protein
MSARPQRGQEVQSRYWLRWLPRGLFMAAAFTPVLIVPFSYHGVREAGSGYWIAVPFCVMVPVALGAFAWVKPIPGGVVALLVMAFVYLFFFFASSFGTVFEGVAVRLFTIEALFIIAAGVLSVVWDAIRWGS